jgi:hypothetical protein
MSLILSIMGIYYAVTGIWPLFHLRSFEMVTGPKVDKWLVKVVGLLAFSSGLVFLYSALMREVIPIEVILLAALNILSFMLMDIWYVFRKIISPVYLADALVQAIFLAIICYLTTR